MVRVASVACMGWLTVGVAVAADLTLTVKTRTDNMLRGRVAEASDTALVLDINDHLVTLFWEDIETSSAYGARKRILVHERGSEANFTAEDHFNLGYFLACRHRHAAAAREFRSAEARDPALAERIRAVWRELREARERGQSTRDGQLSLRADPVVPAGPPPAGPPKRYLDYTSEQHEAALAAYRAFGNDVRDQISPKLVLLETRHFLIWTDWPESTRNLIPDWAEQMYARLCSEFGFRSDHPIWLGKCQVFCFKNKARFKAFARTYDNYDAGGTLAYTKTRTGGYVQLVLRRLGSAPADIDQFATTLVHEGTHAFLHCYVSDRKLPAWFEEGLADYVAERVIPDRSRTGEAAATMARHFVLDGRDIDELFEFTASPPAMYYPIAHSLVEYLVGRDHAAFIALIDDFKAGREFPTALARNFKGMDTKALEVSWRDHIRGQAASDSR